MTHAQLPSLRPRYGVNKKTRVPVTGKASWTVKLKKGNYTYRCDVHFTSGMIGHFKVK